MTALQPKSILWICGAAGATLSTASCGGRGADGIMGFIRGLSLISLSSKFSVISTVPWYFHCIHQNASRVLDFLGERVRVMNLGIRAYRVLRIITPLTWYWGFILVSGCGAYYPVTCLTTSMSAECSQREKKLQIRREINKKTGFGTKKLSTHPGPLHL